MCAFKGCEKPGDMTPKIVFIFNDGTKDWPMPAILDLPTCATCRAARDGVKYILPDSGKNIVDMLLKMRPWAKHVETKLEWIPLTHPDYKNLRGLGPS
jgi:hypothetical protein